MERAEKTNEVEKGSYAKELERQLREGMGLSMKEVNALKDQKVREQEEAKKENAGVDSGEGKKDEVWIIQRLKALWKEHGSEPSIMEAIKEALKDGSVTEKEWESIQTSAALEVAKKAKDQKALEQVAEDESLMKEALFLKEFFKAQENETAALAMDEVLKDGKVTLPELKAFVKAYVSKEDQVQIKKIRGQKETGEASKKKEKVEKEGGGVKRALAVGLMLRTPMPPWMRPLE